MQTAISVTARRVTARKPELEPAIAVAISAGSIGSRQRIEALARAAGAIIAADRAAHDILLIALDSSTPLPASRTALSLLKPASGKVCVMWIGDGPPPSTISRLQRAGVAGIVPSAIEPSRFRRALKAIQARLHIVDAAFNHESISASPSRHDSPPEELTHREQQVLEMMAEGLSNKEVSTRLDISTHTVKFHISSILGKLGAASRTEAVSIGIRTGRLTI